MSVLIDSTSLKRSPVASDTSIASAFSGSIAASINVICKSEAQSDRIFSPLSSIRILLTDFSLEHDWCFVKSTNGVFLNTISALLRARLVFEKGSMGFTPWLADLRQIGANAPRTLNTKGERLHPRSCSQQPSLSSKPTARSRRVPSGASIRYRPPRQRDAAARVGPARLAAVGREPRHRKETRCRLVARAHPHGPHSRPHLSRWGRRPPSAAVRCPARRGRADAPARPCGAAVGAVAQPARRRKGKGPPGRHSPLQRRTGRARVDL